MYTIGKLCKQFNLSRSSLLYYDKIGLLKASERTAKNYRLYSEGDVERLKQIIRHREAGIPLEDISKLFDLEKNSVMDILTERLGHIQADISALKKQEAIILSVLIEEVTLGNHKVFNKASWSILLEKSGYSNQEMLMWHLTFEESDPQNHERFLLALGMTNGEIENLRKKFLGLDYLVSKTIHNSHIARGDFR